MVLKCELFKIIPLHIQELNYGNLGMYELKDHVGEVALSLNLPPKPRLAKKPPFANFPNCLLGSV
jgi:hypothetical protein